MELKLGAPSLSLDSIQEGIDIYFDCHIDSNPLPTTPITWLFNGEPLQPEPGMFFQLFPGIFPIFFYRNISPLII